jgi:hypothetical protein
MDYLQSHVMINVEYLVVIRKKAMEKAWAKVIRETCCKEKEENKVKKFATYFITDEHASQNVATRNCSYQKCKSKFWIQLVYNNY